MAIVLRTNEEVRLTADFHWSSYIRAGVWAALFTLSALGHLIAVIQRTTEFNGSALFFILLIGWMPAIYRFLANKCKHYVVTNQRLYVEEGILAKSKKDIPLQKVNDLEVSQGIIQRMFGAGNLLVLTGNDKPNRLTNIENPEVFKNQISEVLGQIIKKSVA